MTVFLHVKLLHLVTTSINITKRLCQVTDAGLRAIGTACNSLLHVNLSHATAVTDIGVASLSHGCPKLRHINYRGVS